jgi:hypothetical protein
MGSSKSLAELFDTFEREAFRLETLDDYNNGWVEELRSHASKGKRVYRVHILSRPLTPYLRFELGWGYRKNATGGEEFFILDTTDKPNPLEGVGDFWLFDSVSAAFMNYDDSSKFTGAEVLPDSRAQEFIGF